MAVIDEVLEAAGFEIGKTAKETRFIKPPSTTYAVWLDSSETIGGDGVVLAQRHSVTVELYAYTADRQAEAALEAALRDRAADLLDGYEKQERLWLESEALYETIYEFEYIEKQGGF